MGPQPAWALPWSLEGRIRQAARKNSAFQLAAARPSPAGVSLRGRGNFPPGSGEIEAVRVHHLVPRGHEVVHELCLRVAGAVHLGERPELRVRPENEVDTGAS